MLGETKWKHSGTGLKEKTCSFSSRALVSNDFKSNQASSKKESAEEY